MKKYLVDANLPSKIAIWRTEEFEFVANIDDEWTDTEIWNYARLHDLTIISKDSDFSHRIISSHPPPRIIHVKIGNLKLKEFISFIERIRNSVSKLSDTHKLVNLFIDRIEGVE